MGPNHLKGFSIIARRDLQPGELIYELVGLIPKDNQAAHTQLSEIIPHPSQVKRARKPRILFGPIRFINHDCQAINADVSFILLTLQKKLILVEVLGY